MFALAAWPRSTLFVVATATVMASAAGMSTGCSETPTFYPGPPSLAELQAGLTPMYMELAPTLKTPGCATSILELAPCVGQELITQAGCCDATCTVGITKMSSTCVQEYFCLMAVHPVYSLGLYVYMSKMWARCAPNYVAGPGGGICAQAITANHTGSTNGTSSTPSSSLNGCPDPNKYPLIASSTGECPVTNVFFEDVTAQVKERLFFSMGLAHSSCMRSMPNITKFCATEFLTKSGCCSQECAATLLQVDQACAPEATARVCASSPHDPAVKSLLNMFKRCVIGQPYACPASTAITYPLKVWDTCDCPIASKPWTNGYSGMLALDLPEYGGISEFCKKRGASGFIAPCLLDMAFEEGCCSANCWEKLNTVASRECAGQWLEAMCKYPGGELMAHGFENLLKRCQDGNVQQLTCQDFANATANNTSANASLAASAHSGSPSTAGVSSLLSFLSAAGPLLLWLEGVL